MAYGTKTMQIMIGVSYGSQYLGSDLQTFWITNPTNNIARNFTERGAFRVFPERLSSKMARLLHMLLILGVALVYISVTQGELKCFITITH